MARNHKGLKNGLTKDEPHLELRLDIFKDISDIGEN